MADAAIVALANGASDRIEALALLVRAERKRCAQLEKERDDARAEVKRMGSVLQRVADHASCDNTPDCTDESEPLARADYCVWCAIVADIDAEANNG